MQKGIELIFGKRNKKNGFLNVGYWFFVMLYILAIIFSVFLASDWLSIVLFVIIFPLVFRVSYALANLVLRNVNGKVLVVIGCVFIISMVVLVVSAFLFSDNLAVNATKTEVDGNLQLSIDKLKGNYNVAEFEVNREGTIAIPYEVTVGGGVVLLMVEKDSETLWEEEISSSSEGYIQLEGELGRYNIQLMTDRAEDVFVQLSDS